MDQLRVRLIEQLCTLPESHLAKVADFLACLDENPAGEHRGSNTKFTAMMPHKDWPRAPIHRLSEHGTYIVHVSGIENQLATFLSHLHTSTATEANRRDGTPERGVWFNYWDTHLTFEKSYLARLNYVHQNAVRNGLVKTAGEYRWCSAAWFEGTATKSQIKTLYSFKIDRVNIDDDYVPE